jgi:hypothetical protein
MNPIDKPGIYEMTAAEYHADPCAVPSLSSTVAKLLVTRSPAHAHLAHPKLGGLKDDDDDGSDPTASKEKALGELIHRLVLDKGGDIVVIQADAYRTTAAKLERDTALSRGQIPVLAHKLPAAQAAAEAARKQLDDLGLDHVFRDGKMEVVLVWEEDGVWLRAMLDQLIIDEDSKMGDIWDLKTVGRSSHPKACSAQIEALGYDLSLAFYSRGLAKLRPDLAGRIRKHWAFMEVKAPYSVTPCEITGEWEMVANHNTERAIALWRKCMTEGRWPHYVDAMVRLEPKPWILNDLLSSTSHE